MRKSLNLIAIAVALMAVSTVASAAKIAIIGSGNVATALGPGFAAQGHTIVYGSRNPGEQKVKDLVAKTGHGATAAAQNEAVKDADIVVLAVPGTAAEQVVKSLGDLSGKIILDPTNRVDRSTSDGYANYGLASVTGSNAELVQAAQPKAHVVKAFNTLNVKQMTDPASSGGALSIPICGNDAKSREVVAGLVKGMHLEPVDMGPLRYARVLEEMLVIWANARSHGAPYNYYLRPEPKQN
jgi:8-hydroxy-5-deazaflavin:NADPH oxidoreductase